MITPTLPRSFELNFRIACITSPIYAREFNSELVERKKRVPYIETDLQHLLPRTKSQVYVSNTDQRRVPASRFEIDPKDMVILCIWDMTSTVCKDISRNNEMNLGEKNVSRRERHLISCFLVFLGNVKDILWSIHVRQSSM